MLFHEIYSTYFQTVAKILTEAVDHPLAAGALAIDERRRNDCSQKEADDAAHNFAETLD